jgi:hypothetical protein
MTDTTETNAAQAAKKLERPRKADPQRVDYHELSSSCRRASPRSFG